MDPFVRCLTLSVEFSLPSVETLVGICPLTHVQGLHILRYLEHTIRIVVGSMQSKDNIA